MEVRRGSIALFREEIGYRIDVHGGLRCEGFEGNLGGEGLFAGL